MLKFSYLEGNRLRKCLGLFKILTELLPTFVLCALRLTYK